MGDRGMIVVDNGYGGNQIGLYTHWFGSNLLNTLQKALQKGKDRWDDPAYLARIIFCEMIAEDSTNDGLTGFGIFPIDLNEFPCDLIGNRNPIIVRPEDKEITIDETVISFENFVSLDISDLKDTYE